MSVDERTATVTLEDRQRWHGGDYVAGESGGARSLSSALAKSS